MNPLTQIKNTQKITKREIELGLFEKVIGSFCSEQPAFQQVPTRLQFQNVYGPIYASHGSDDAACRQHLCFCCPTCRCCLLISLLLVGIMARPLCTQRLHIFRRT
jgi:hypothetical protein